MTWPPSLVGRTSQRPPLALCRACGSASDRQLDELGQRLALLATPMVEARGFERELGKLRPRPLRKRARARGVLVADELIELALQRANVARGQPK